MEYIIMLLALLVVLLYKVGSKKTRVIENQRKVIQRLEEFNNNPRRNSQIEVVTIIAEKELDYSDVRDMSPEEANKRVIKGMNAIIMEKIEGKLPEIVEVTETDNMFERVLNYKVKIEIVRPKKS